MQELGFPSSLAIAQADAGIPMLWLAYPVLLELLLLVILIEALYLKLKLHTAWWRTAGTVAVANIATMLLGFPLMWLIYVMLELSLFWTLDRAGVLNHFGKFSGTTAARIIGIVLSAAWMGDPGAHRHWPILLAFVVLLIPSFFLSGYVEAWILNQNDRLSLQGCDIRSVWQANVVSYIIVAAIGCVILYERIKYY